MTNLWNNRFCIRIAGVVFLLVVCAGCGDRGEKGVYPFRETILQELAAAGDQLFCETGTHVVVCSPNSSLTRQLSIQAEDAFEQIGWRLDLPDLKQPVFLGVIASTQKWARLTEHAGWRREGLSIQVGSEIWMLSTTNRNCHIEVPHELVHLRLRHAYGDALPLALEEGLALHLGWILTERFWRFQGRNLTRIHEPPVGTKPFSLSELLAFQKYPTDPAENNMFYWQSELWVKHLVELMGETSLADFVRRVAEGAEWEEALLMQPDVLPSSAQKIRESVLEK